MNIISNSNLKFNSGLSTRKSTVKIILHHADATSASVEKIHSWHLARGWVGIGYNFYIRKDGTIYEGRGWDKVGAHCSGHNSTSLGICFEGDYEATDTKMPEAQYNAGIGLIADALAKYPTITEICGHKKYIATACPGKYFPLASMSALSSAGTSAVTSNQDEIKAAEISRDDNVKSLQEALNVDGIRDASGNTLVVDGINGKNTSAAMKKILLKSGVLSSGKYKVGSSGEVVKWLQTRLNAVLGSNLKADGKYGNDTRAAVGEWQKAKNLTVDYIAGVDTITSLL